MYNATVSGCLVLTVYWSSFVSPHRVQQLCILPCALINTILLLTGHLVCVFTLLRTRKHNISGDKDMIMPSLGKIAFTNINRYLKSLEQYFITNGVQADTAE